MEKFFLTILHSWGTEAPPEVIWALNELLNFAISKGFNSNGDFFVEYSEENADKINDSLCEKLIAFFEKL